MIYYRCVITTETSKEDTESPVSSSRNHVIMQHVPAFETHEELMSFVRELVTFLTKRGFKARGTLISLLLSAALGIEVKEVTKVSYF